MRARASVIVLLFSLALVGCSDSGEDGGEQGQDTAIESSTPMPESTPTLTPQPADEEDDLRCVTAESGQEFCDDPTDFPNATNYEEAKQICELFGVQAIAKEYKTKPKAVDAAEGYAKGAVGSAEQATYEGCLDGLLA